MEVYWSIFLRKNEKLTEIEKSDKLYISSIKALSCSWLIDSDASLVLISTEFKYFIGIINSISSLQIEWNVENTFVSIFDSSISWTRKLLNVNILKSLVCRYFDSLQWS